MIFVNGLLQNQAVSRRRVQTMECEEVHAPGASVPVEWNLDGHVPRDLRGTTDD